MTKDWTEIKKEFSKPFKVQWRVMNMPKDGKFDPTKKYQMVPYIDARDVMNRLDEVVGPENWHSTGEVIFMQAGDKLLKGLKTRLTVLGVTKEDVGDFPAFSALKGGYSDGLKRAAVHFGIGRFLYETFPVWCLVDSWGKPANDEEKKKIKDAQSRMDVVNKDEDPDVQGLDQDEVNAQNEQNKKDLKTDKTKSTIEEAYTNLISKIETTNDLKEFVKLGANIKKAKSVLNAAGETQKIKLLDEKYNTKLELLNKEQANKEEN